MHLSTVKLGFIFTFNPLYMTG